MVFSDKNVPCVVGSILKNIECSAKNQYITTEEDTVDSKDLSKHDAKGHKVSHVEITENAALKNENPTSLVNNTRLKDAKFGSPELPYPVVTMDARSRNKTAALIRMVVQADASNGAKLPKSGQAVLSQFNSPVKREPSNGHVLDVLRRLNSVVNSYQPEYSQKGDLRKSERRYVITNFDVIDSYIKSRREEKKPSSDHEWLNRRNDKADEVDQTSEGPSAEEESDKLTTENSNAVADAEDKLDYDDKSDDYIISTKRNVWDYEHEDWADVKKVNWDDVHSSKDTSVEGKTVKGKDDKLKITIKNFANLTKAKDKVVLIKKNDQEAEDSDVKIVMPLNLKSKSKTNKADIHKAVKINLKKHGSRIDEKISISEKYSLKVTERSSTIRLEVTKNIKEQNTKGTIEENEYFKSEADWYRADRSNKSPNLNKADNWQKDNKMDELDGLDTKDKADDETYKNPVRRGKLNSDDYNDRKIEEKSKLSDRHNQRIYKNSKEDQKNDDDKFKKPTKDNKDYADNVQKKKGGKEYGDYKDSYDYRDKKKKKQGYSDKKPVDNDYKDTKKRSSDYKDYYGGKENKKKTKDQDYTDKKIDNDYKNTDNKDYKDDYGKNKKRERNLDDDYKNKKDKNTDYNMDYDKKDKKKNNDWEIKTKDKWPEERNDNKDDFKNKKSNKDNWDSPIDSREKKSAKSSDKEYNKKKKDELDYNNPENKNKNDPFDKHANNDWGNVGLEQKSGNSDRFEMTTRRTTKRFIDDYEKPARKPKDYDEMDTTKYKFDKTTKRFDRNENKNWDSIGRTKRKRLDFEPYVERPRGKSKSQRGGGDRSSGGFNNHVRTPLPMREGKSVYESD